MEFPRTHPTARARDGWGVMHPLAFPGHRSGAFDMRAGDRIVHEPDGLVAVADEFLSDGDVLVSLEGGGYATWKWNNCRPADHIADAGKMVEIPK